jgi:OOP family OmpA-OmpF porin
MSVALSAQEKEQFIDCRQQDCSPKVLEQALFPDAAPPLNTHGTTRAVNAQRLPGPSIQGQPLPAPISVGLNVLFEFNSDQIVPKYYTDLDKVGQVLERHTDGRFYIEGHTDSKGSDAYNQVLSDKRAASVKRYLVQHFSIAPERLVTQGYGKSRPRTTDETEGGRATNRRVELVRK